MNHLTITIPYPDPKLNAHHKTHWRAVRPASKAAREAGYAMALYALDGAPPPNWTRARMDMVFWFPCNSGQDLINFAQMCKAAVDGIVDARIIADDNHTVLRPTSQDFGGYDADNPRCEITFTPIQDTV